LDAPFFHGQHEVSVDAKNRLLVPSEIRRRIKPEIHGKDFFIILGQNRRPWLYPERFYEELVNEKKPELMPGPAQTDYDRMTLALAQLVELDTNGRILIPVRSMAWMGLKETKEFYLLGVRSHLELWDKPDWEKERHGMPERSPDIEAAVRQERKTQ